MKKFLSLFSLLGMVHGVEYRSFDGSGNNLTNPDWGSVGQPLDRIAPANYVGGQSVDLGRANPREISNLIFDQVSSLPDPNGLSEMGWAWGQFLDHDIDHTLISGSNGLLEITVPNNDPFFGDLGSSNKIRVSRSNFELIGGVREQTTNINAWIDGSVVYGGRAIDGPSSLDRSDWLRANDGSGKMKVSDGGALGDLLPKWDSTTPVMANTNRPHMGSNAFVAGDVRANEHTALISLHTLFVREHNRLAGVIAGQDATLTGDQIYDRARKIVGSQIQAITYNEFLPSIGIDLTSYAGYDSTIDPTVTNEFANAAFRMGHSQINGTMLRLNADGSTIPEGHLNLVQGFFDPGRIQEGGLEATLLGLSAQVQEATDGQLVGELRNQLFQRFIPGAGLVDNASDLAAINILRGRDHGLGTYNETRVALGFTAATDYSQITDDPETAQALATLYGAAGIDEVDLYVAMLLEGDLPDSIMGEVGMAILADQFSRLKDGDRFFYKNQADGIHDDLQMVATWDENEIETTYDFISELTLSDLIELNTDVTNLSDNVFFAQAVPEPSSALLLLLAGSYAGLRRRRNG